MIKIYNENCLKTMNRPELRKKVNIILTSPPYNRQTNHKLYDQYQDNLQDDEYLEFTANLFAGYNRILKKNGAVIYILSYSSGKSDIMTRIVNEINTKTNFIQVEVLPWIKSTRIPMNISPNKLNRIVEFIFVFCRKSEINTFHSNKRLTGYSSKGQKLYTANSDFDNIIIAKNNDGHNPFNKATFSIELVKKLLNIYAKSNITVYDSFSGTGTTGCACKEVGLNYYGSELSKAQCQYSKQRLKGIKKPAK